MAGTSAETASAAGELGEAKERPGALPHRHQDKLLREKKTLCATRGGTIHGGDARTRISARGRLASDSGPSSRRSGPRRSGSRDRRHPAPPRRWHQRWRDTATAIPGARSRRQKPAGDRRLGWPDWPGRVDRAVAERATAPVGGLPLRGDAAFAGGQDRPAGGVVWALLAPGRWQHGEPSGQQGDRLADPRGLRSRPWRLPPSGSHRRVWRGITAALRTCCRRGGDRRSRLCQGTRTACMSRGVRPASPRLHRADWLECAGAARCPGRPVQPDRDARRAAGADPGTRVGGAGAGWFLAASCAVGAAPDRAAAARRQGRGQSTEAEAQGQPRSAEARSTQPDRSWFHGAGYLVARRHSGGRNLRRLSLAMANRVGVQAAEIPDPYRPITNPHRARQPELAVCSPDRSLADRRHEPGDPGIFPLRTLLTAGARRPYGGSARLPSRRCASPCSGRSTCAPCWPPVNAGTNASPIPGDDDKGRYFTQYPPYPDAYGAKPLGGFQGHITNGGAWGNRRVRQAAD